MMDVTFMCGRIIDLGRYTSPLGSGHYDRYSAIKSGECHRLRSRLATHQCCHDPCKVASPTSLPKAFNMNILTYSTKIPPKVGMVKNL